MLRQNVLAAAVLTASLAVIIAGLAKLIASGFDLGATLPFVDLALVSVVGGVLASSVVLLAALGLTSGAVRYGWDLDNVTAPIVSTLGDVLTLPALLLATGLLDARRRDDESRMAADARGDRSARRGARLAPGGTPADRP